jgi:hypothetical protein
MITDPKTVPAGRVGRVVFGALVAVASTLLIAPQTNEFGTKVALLAGLVVLCAVRPILDLVLPEPRSAADDLGRFAARLAFGDGVSAGVLRGAARVGLAVAVVVVLGVGVVAAGTPARGLVVPDTTEMLAGLPHQVDPATFPAITLEQDIGDYDSKISLVRDILVTLAEDLELENQALLRSDGGILTAVDHGDRLKEMQGRLEAASASGRTVIHHYRFDAVHVIQILPFGVQSGISIGFQSRGVDTQQTYDVAGALLDQRVTPFATTFAVRRATGDRWLIVAALPLGPGD